MKSTTTIDAKLIDETLNGLSEGLQPIIQDLDITKLTEAEKDALLEKLDELEAKALEVKGGLGTA